jgi:hypothetical protein
MSTTPPPEVSEMLARARGEMPELAGHPPPAEQPTEAFEAVSNGDAPGSVIAALRAQHRKIARRRTTVIELPRGLWNGLMAVRYHHVDDRTYRRLAQAAEETDPSRNRAINADVLIAACDEVLGRTDENADWGPLEDGRVFRFDPELAAALQLGEVKGARGVVYRLFGETPEEATAPLARHAFRFGEWLSGEAPEVAEQLQGE